MSKLDNLIKQYCPDGVEYKRLGDIGTFRRGGNFQKKDMTSSGVPCIHYGQIYVYYGLFSSSTISFLPAEIAVTQKKANPGEIIIAITSENIEDVCKAVVWEGSEPVCISGHSAIFESELNPRYVAYYLQTEAFQQQKRKYAHGVKVIEISPEQIAQCTIPCPNRNIQDEIVHILDSFTKLTAELTAELTARRAQYKYYRDKLLTFDDETAIVKRIKDMLDQTCGGPEKVEYKPLSDVVGIRRGKRVTRQELFENGEYPVFQNSLVPLGYYDEYNVESETPYIICAGAAGDIGYCSGKFWAADDCFFIEHPEKITRRYVYYFLLTKQEYLKSKVRKASVPRLAHEFIDKLEIPMPPFEVQQEIVSVLDKFNTLTTDISRGLPAEISLRQKQYEHYRDRLLNFNGGGYALNNSLCYVKILTLKEVSNVFRGEYITKKDVEEGSIPVILGGQEPAYYINRSNHEGEIIVIARSGASAGFVSYWNCPIFVTDGFGYEAKDTVAITKYLFYVLKNMERTLNSMKRGAGVPHVSGESLSNVLLPIPPIEEQEKITAILDKFDSLCNDLSEGLPAEIEARKKQYEYYRDKLLDFKEKKA